MKDSLVNGKNILPGKGKRGRRVVTYFDHENFPSLTQQQFKEECDVNNIIAKYKKTGVVAHVNPNSGVYGDFTEIGDFQDMLHKVSHAQDLFEQLPSVIRNKFENDPQKLINYLDDPKNDDEAIQLGLRTRQKIEPNPVLDELKTLNKNLAPKTKKADD